MIKIQSTTETIESKGGLLLAGKLAMKVGLGVIRSIAVKNAGIIIACMFGLMVEGKSDFESMKEKRGSLFFKKALGIDFVYAKETVRLYLEEMADDGDAVIEQLKETSTRIIKESPLHGIWIQGRHYLPVDIDTVALNNSKTKKEGVSRTYRGFDGYHPIIAYVGKEGYILDCELRPGSQHCQNGTPLFITGLVERLSQIQSGGRFLFRLDSGNDAWDTLQAIKSGGSGYYCIVKRNNRQENKEMWLEQAKREGQMSVPREGKTVWVGTASSIHPKKKKEIFEDISCVYEVIERQIDKKGNRLLIPDIEINLWWTNLTCAAAKVIELYCAHATSEQFHSELKHDMGIERLPSGKFAVNKILLAVAMNAYNALRHIGQRSIEAEGSNKMLRRKRLGKVILDVICVAGKLVKHGRELIFKINELDPMFPVFVRLNAALGFL